MDVNLASISGRFDLIVQSEPDHLGIQDGSSQECAAVIVRKVICWKTMRYDFLVRIVGMIITRRLTASNSTATVRQ
jgi:hypothetical protein